LRTLNNTGARCRWKNPSDRPVSFGPTTEDEMCFSTYAIIPDNHS